MTALAYLKCWSNGKDNICWFYFHNETAYDTNLDFLLYPLSLFIKLLAKLNISNHYMTLKWSRFVVWAESWNGKHTRGTSERLFVLSNTHSMNKKRTASYFENFKKKKTSVKFRFICRSMQQISSLWRLEQCRQYRRMQFWSNISANQCHRNVSVLWYQRD